MANDDGLGVVGGIVVMGTVYWIGYVLALAFVAAVVALIAAALIGVGVGILAVVGWSRYLGEARARGDRAWAFDLWGAPAAGLATVVVLIASGLLRSAVDWDQAGAGDQLSELPIGVQLVIGPGAFILWVSGIILTVNAIGASRPFRYAAYPGFIMYSGYGSGMILSLLVGTGLV